MMMFDESFPLKNKCNSGWSYSQYKNHRMPGEAIAGFSGKINHDNKWCDFLVEKKINITSYIKTKILPFCSRQENFLCCITGNAFVTGDFSSG
jgi:hypothetical protein